MAALCHAVKGACDVLADAQAILVDQAVLLAGDAAAKPAGSQGDLVLAWSRPLCQHRRALRGQAVLLADDAVLDTAGSH